MQKLFSAFPDGRPGFGMLLLRGLVSVTLIAQTIAHITTTSISLPNLFIAGLALLIAGCLLMGFLTPLAAILIGLGAITFSVLRLPLPVQYPFDTTHTLVEVIVLSVVILLLGPGAFSFDARMFGRREIRIPPVSHPKSKGM